MTPINNFGKHYASMYQGSMVGAGAVPFALMGYIISNQIPVGEVGKERMEVELNPKLLAFIFGESESAVEGAIRFLEGPDEKSRTKAEEGRRIVRVGQFAYWVVNGMAYREHTDSERRREQNRAAQARFRAKKKGVPLAGEAAFVKAVKDGDEKLADQILGAGLPSQAAPGPVSHWDPVLEMVTPGPKPPVPGMVLSGAEAVVRAEDGASLKPADSGQIQQASPPAAEGVLPVAIAANLDYLRARNQAAQKAAEAAAFRAKMAAALKEAAEQGDGPDDEPGPFPEV